MKYTLFLILLLSLPPYATATIRNVPASYATIQSGLLACSTGDTVLVQPGTYYESLGWPQVGNIKLFSAGDSSNTIIDGGGLYTTISIILNTSFFLDSNTVIKGFKITGGGCAIPTSMGCGVVIQFQSPKLEEVNITGNYTNWQTVGGDGAGITGENSNFILINSSVSYNYIENGTIGYGGGISIYEGSPTINNVKVFKNYNALRGNGIACRYASPTINNVSVFENDSNGFAGSQGAGMYFRDNISIILNNSTVFNHYSASQGTGIYFSNDSSIILNNVTVHHNKSTLGNGAGICISGATKVTLNNVIIENNVIEGVGYSPGIILGADSSFLDNVLINSNSVGTVNNNNKIVGLGISGYTNILNSTIANNFVMDSLATNTTGISVYPNSTSNLTNSIVWNEDLSVEISGATTNINTTYSNIRGGYTGTGNIDTLPGFVSLTDFHLTPGSPCLGAGTLLGAPPLDLDSLPRPAPVGTNPDMGCYELDQPLGIHQQNETSNNIAIFPNPSNGIFIIQSASSFTCVEVFDMMGKLILQQSDETLSQTAIDLNSQSKGLYFIKVTMKSGAIEVEKVLVK